MTTLARADSRMGRHPFFTVMGLFVLLVLLGAAALRSPWVTDGGVSIGLLDVVFTAASAVCVNGLSVVDIADDLSRGGQLVLMVLCQLGALAMIVACAMFARWRGGDRSPEAPSPEREVAPLWNIPWATIVGTVVIVETCGAVALYGLLPRDEFSVLSRMFNAAFHSVSSFSQAGFSVYHRGLEPFYSDALLNLVVAGLMIAGGIGYVAQHELWRFVRRRPGGDGGRPVGRQTRLVLITTLGIVAVATLGLWLLEGGSVSPLEAFFQAVTPRSTGLQTVSQDRWTAESQLVTVGLMFVGAAPGSPAGGIKVTTLAVLIGLVAAGIRRRKTRFGGNVVRAAIAVTASSLFAVGACVVLLWVTETAAFRLLLFEAVSAFGASGLSLGVTPQLSSLGKVTLIVTMIVGRALPLSVALSALNTDGTAGRAHPCGRIVVG